jgi:hypothetical protein
MPTKSAGLKKKKKVSSTAWALEELVTGSRSRSYFATAATTLIIKTQLTYAVNTMCGKLTVYRCIRTETDIFSI